MRFIGGGLLILGTGLGLASARASEPPTFERDVRPIFKTYCLDCHGGAEQLKGQLDLRLRRFVVRGGASGPALVPGNADKSLLIGAIKYESYEMPPTGRLPASVIEDFVKWVKMGAPDPRDATAAPMPRRAAFEITAEDRRHWAFQPVSNPPLPSVRATEWIRDDLDRFVLARMEQAGRRPNAEADRNALLRRTTFALTGLPPSPEEIDTSHGP